MSTIGINQFPGKIGLSYDESKPWWTQPVRPPHGAPNVLMIVLDDVGFGHLSCYGGSVETPNIDELASQGLRYTQFHTTALCSPTRSCLLTGRNHHSNHMACVTEIPSPYPGYDAIIPKENGTIAEYLKARGYATYALGKWHLTPAEDESWLGPYDRWPLGKGFNHFYGFLGGETNQWYPDLVEDNRPVEPPGGPDTGYSLTTDLANKAIEYIGSHLAIEPEVPFFMYFCPGACHAPHHAPKEWIDKYKGQFDEGWDKVREDILARQKRMGIVPADTELAPHLATFEGPSPTWDSLNADEKRLYSRMMEVFAGYLSYADHEIGKLIDFLKANDTYDNTIIIIVSDNGASGEGGVVGSTNEMKFFNGVPENIEENLKAIDDLGGPKCYNHYPQGWALAGNTPFKFYKRYVYEGGVSDPLIVLWPGRIKSRGEIRSQYHHAIDLVPTILELTGIEAPSEFNGISQRPIEGISMVYSLEDGTAPTRKETQYYEMLGGRGIWHKGWKAVTTHQPMSETGNFEKDEWELYLVDEDRSELHNLALQYPEKVMEMRVRWFVEATKYNVLPLDDRGVSRIRDLSTKPKIIQKRSNYVYYTNMSRIPESIAANIKNISHSIKADVEIRGESDAGVILAQGALVGGYSIFIKDRKLTYVYNYLGISQSRVVSNIDVPIGRVRLGVEFAITGPPDFAHGKGAPGIARLSIDDRNVGQTDVLLTVPITFGLEGLCCGRDEGSPVTSEYGSPFAFTGKINRVVVSVGGEPTFDPKAELRKVLATA